MAYLYQELEQLVSTAVVIDAAERQTTCGIQGADRKAMRGRYHPYGARSNCSSNGCANWDPTFAYAKTVEKPSYWPGFNRLPALDFLSNELARQTNTLSHPNTLQSIHNFCSLRSGSNIPTFDTTTLTSASVSEQRRLEQYHPFYLRRRTAPADGLTRTRDKYRVVYTEHQRKGLERAYEQNKFISIKTKMELAQELDLSDRQIKIWFQNRRAKERRQKNKESDVNKEEQNPSKEYSTRDSISGADLGNWSPTASEGVRELSSCRFQTAQTSPMYTYFFGKDQWGLMDKKNSSQSCQFLSHSVNNRSSTSVQKISPSKWPSAGNGLLPCTNVSPLNVNLGLGYDPRL